MDNKYVLKKYELEREINELIVSLAELGVYVIDDNGELRPTSDILKDISDQCWYSNRIYEE